MTNDRDLDTKVRTWLADPPPGPPDRNAVHARVMDRLPETHQRRHWWPFKWNPFATGATRSADAHGPQPLGRSRTMFNATRVVAAAAIVALGGSALLIAGPLGPSEPLGPAGAEASTAPTEVVHFTGHVATGEGRVGEIETLPDRTIERGWQSTFYNTMSDPRVSGGGSAINYLETIEAGGFMFLSHASKGELVNDGGTFGLSCSGAGNGGGSASEEAPMGSIVCWYEGADGYDGLSAFVVLTSSSPVSGSWQADGWLFSGEVPSVE